MRIFLAGATGVIGQRLALLLRHAEHEVAGTTRNPAKEPMLRELGIVPVVVDVFEPDQLARAIVSAKPDVVIHQLTDPTSASGTPGYPAAQQAANAALLAVTKGLGVYNISDGDGIVSIAKATRD